MKDTHFLYAVSILAIIGVAAVFVGYATDTLPTNTPRQLTTVPAPVTTETPVATTAQKKKSCSCCAERMAKLKEHIDRIRKRQKSAAQLTVSK